MTDYWLPHRVLCSPGSNLLYDDCVIIDIHLGPYVHQAIICCMVTVWLSTSTYIWPYVHHVIWCTETVWLSLSTEGLVFSIWFSLHLGDCGCFRHQLLHRAASTAVPPGCSSVLCYSLEMAATCFWSCPSPVSVDDSHFTFWHPVHASIQSAGFLWLTSMHAHSLCCSSFVPTHRA